MKDKIKNQKNIFFMASIFFSLIMIFVALFNMPYQSFENDELYTVGFICDKNSFIDLLKIYITDEVTNPPLYAIFLYFWYRIVPRTVFWMLLPNLIIFTIGTYFIHKLLYEITGRYEAVFASICITWLGYFRFRYMIYNLRSYAMLFMFSALVLYFYYRRLRDESGKNIFLLGLFMLLASFSHYFGAVTMMSYAILDLILFLMKRVKFRSILSYIMVFLLLFPYLMLSFANSTKNLSSFWGDKDSVLVVGIYMAANLGNAVIFMIIFCCFVLYLVRNIKKIKERQLSLKEIIGSADSLIRITAIFNIFFTFVSTFIYSFYINPEGSIFIRYYFTSVVPQLILLSGFLINELYSLKIFEGRSYLCWIFSGIVIISMIFGGVGFHNFYEVFQMVPYSRNMAEYIRSDKDRGNTPIFVAAAHGGQWDVAKYPVNGLKEFYLNDLDIDITDDVEELKNYSKVYVWWYEFRGWESETPDILYEHLNDEMQGFEMTYTDLDLGMSVFERN